MSTALAIEPDFPRPNVCAADQLGAEITELCGYIHAASAHLLALIREFDENRYWEDAGFPSCVSWLNFKCGFAPGTAREKLRVAHTLVALPKISAAFAEGSLSFSKVRAMTRVATPENEDMLLMVATHGTASHVEQLVAQYRRAEKLQHPNEANELYRAREVTYYYDHEGCLVIKGRLPADAGEVIVKALEKVVEDQYDAGADEPVPIAARRADALCELAESSLHQPESNGSTADRYMVTVHVETTGDSHLENGPHVPAETSRRIQCDCSTCTIVEDGFGEPLNIGRRSRTIPPAMRRALQARDGGCRFPGCTNHKFCDGHHIKHWSDGGETSLDNLILLCRFHHHLVHEGGFDCKRSSAGDIWFEDRRAQRIAEYQASEPKSIEETLAWMHRKFENQHVSAETCQTKWYAGERMDIDLAVAGMCQRDLTSNHLSVSS